MQSIFIEEEREIPVAWEGDVLVVGAGSAGVPAALAAARRGSKTLIVEQLGVIGGSSTAALVTPLMHSGIPGNPGTAINSEINQRMIDLGYARREAHNGNDGWFDPLALSFVLEEMLREAGVKILFQTFFSDVIRDGDELQGVIVENKAGRQALMAKRIIDCSGDADVAFRAGCPFDSGDPKTGLNQPTSLRFEMGGIDLEKFSEFLTSLGQKEETDPMYFHTAVIWGRGHAMEALFRKAVEDGELHERDGHYFQAFSVPGKTSCLSFNCPEIPPSSDVTQPDYLAQALGDGRRSIFRLARFMKKRLPGFESAFITQVATLLGIRESRRIRGEYVLSGKDILTYARFDDAVARSNYPVDIHGVELQCGSFEIPETTEEEKYYELPYRSLVPLEVENLLVAGRCLSADFVGQSSPRIQMVCRAMGEAAGIAASLSIAQEKTFRALDGTEVRTIMKETGAFL